MEIDNKNNSIEALSVEPSPSKDDQDHEYGLSSAHTTDHGLFRFFFFYSFSMQ